METDAQAEFFPLVTPAMPLYGIDALESGCLLPSPGGTGCLKSQILLTVGRRIGALLGKEQRSLLPLVEMILLKNPVIDDLEILESHIVGVSVESGPGVILPEFRTAEVLRIRMVGNPPTEVAFGL